MVALNYDHLVTEEPTMGIRSLICGLLYLAEVGSATPTQKRAPTADGYYVTPYYPAPFGGWVGEWAKSYDKAKKLVGSMTLAEKTNITAGSGLFMGMNPLLEVAPTLQLTRM